MASGGDNVDDYVDYQTVILCDGCGGMVNVSSYCINCPGNLCDTCKASHPNSNLTRRHRVLPRGHPAAVKVRRSISLPCKLHPENEYITYCKKCQIPCCASCITKEHDAHNFCELEEVGEESRKEISDFIDTLENDLLPSTEKAANKLRKKEGENQSQKEKHEESVKHTIRSLRKQLDRVESDALAHLAHLYSARSKEISTHQRNVEGSRKTLRNTIDKFKARLKECSNIEAVVLRSECPDPISLQLPEISVSQLPELGQSSYKLPSSREVVGEFITKTEKDVIHGSSPVKPEPPPQFQESMIEVQNMHSFDVAVVPYSMTHFIDNKAWIVDKSTLVKYDTSGNMLKQLKLSFTIDDITRSPRNEVFATDTASKHVMTVTDTGHSTLFISTAPLSPRGICINDRQQLVVGLGYENPPIKLVVYDINIKNVVQEIEQEENGHRIFLHDIYRVAQNGNGDYMVVDTNNFYPKLPLDEYMYNSEGRLLCVSKKGRRRWVYQCSGARDVVCDKYHNVIFCDDWYKEVVLFDSEGEMTRKLLTKEDCLGAPLSLSINNVGFINVGKDKGYTRGEVQVVRYVSQ